MKINKENNKWMNKYNSIKERIFDIDIITFFVILFYSMLY
jgi:hypothetical protein